MATKLTLSLPASAAAKLAALTPDQLAELSKILGYDIQSVRVWPTESTRRQRCNAELSGLPTYHDAAPWAEIDAILSRHDFNPVPEADAVPTFGAAGCGDRMHVKVGDATWLLVTIYRMPSGKYEVVAYVS
jgi:hypothetical protein